MLCLPGPEIYSAFLSRYCTVYSQPYFALGYSTFINMLNVATTLNFRLINDIANESLKQTNPTRKKLG